MRSGGEESFLICGLAPKSQRTGPATSVALISTELAVVLRSCLIPMRTKDHKSEMAT